MVLTPGCKSESKESKTCRRYDDRTIGRGTPVDISQMIFPSDIGIGQALRVSDDKDVCRFRISGSVEL